MLFGGKRHKAEDLLPRELWLYSGNFREEEAAPGENGFYALPGGDAAVTSRFCPQVHLPPLLAIVRHTLNRLAPASPVILTVTECPAQPPRPNWKERFPMLYQAALSRCNRNWAQKMGAISEERFLFSAFPDALYADFQRSLYDTHSYDGNACLICSYQKADAFSPSKETVCLEKNTLVRLYLDLVHPVLILQVSPEFPLEKLKNAIKNACEQEAWQFCDKVR